MAALFACVVVGCGDPVPRAGGADGGAAGARSDRVPGFEEVAESVGLRFRTHFLEGEQGRKFKINLYDHGSGVCVEDYDGDGRDDVYLLDQLGPNALFHNEGGRFVDVTARAGVALGDRICTSAAFADVDNDGDRDLFVVSTRGGNVFFRNDGDGVFSNATIAAGLVHTGHSQGAAFFDYDGDGLLDLFVTNTARWTADERDPSGRYHLGPPGLFDLVASPPEKDILYHNDGGGTFSDVTAEAGVAGQGWSGDIAVFDHDGDGRPDLFVANMFGRSTLFRNEDGHHFADVTAQVLGRTPWGGVGAKVLDFDGDGRLDLLVSDMHSDMWMPSDVSLSLVDPLRKYAPLMAGAVEVGTMTPAERDDVADRMDVDEDAVVYGNALYVATEGGGFREVSDAVGAETLWPWGIAVADFDLDGFEDVFFPAGMGYPYEYWANELLMNDGGSRLVDRAADEGIEPRPGGPDQTDTLQGESSPKSSRSAAILDFDGDGRPDLVVNNFNERAYLYRNRFPARHWLALRLEGTRGNRDAIGAVARLYVGDDVQVRQVNAAGGYLAESTRTLYFGLADGAAVDRVEITWPGGATQVIDAPAVDTVLDVVETE